eukprot:364805-Chlamydomonas_euryale.AAC.4
MRGGADEVVVRRVVVRRVVLSRGRHGWPADQQKARAACLQRPTARVAPAHTPALDGHARQPAWARPGSPARRARLSPGPRGVESIPQRRRTPTQATAPVCGRRGRRVANDQARTP